MLLPIGIAVALATPGAVALGDEHLGKPVWDGSQRLSWRGPAGERYVLGLNDGTWQAELTSTVPAEVIGSPAIGIRLVPVADDPDTYLLRLRGKLPAFDRLAIDARHGVPGAGHASQDPVRVPVDTAGRLLLVDAEGSNAGEYRLELDGTPYAVFRSTVKGLQSRVQEDGRDIPAEWDPDKGVVLLPLRAEEKPRRADLLLHVEPPDSSATGEEPDGPDVSDRRASLETRALEVLRRENIAAYRTLLNTEEPWVLPPEASADPDRAWAVDAWEQWRDSDLQALLEQHLEREANLAEAQRHERDGLETYTLAGDLSRAVKRLAQQVWAAERRAEEAKAGAADTERRRAHLEQRVVAVLKSDHWPVSEWLPLATGDHPDPPRAATALRELRAWLAAYDQRLQTELAEHLDHAGKQGSGIAPGADDALDAALRPWVDQLASQMTLAEVRRQAQVAEEAPENSSRQRQAVLSKRVVQLLKKDHHAEYRLLVGRDGSAEKALRRAGVAMQALHEWMAAYAGQLAEQLGSLLDLVVLEDDPTIRERLDAELSPRVDEVARYLRAAEERQLAAESSEPEVASDRPDGEAEASTIVDLRLGEKTDTRAAADLGGPFEGVDVSGCGPLGGGTGGDGSQARSSLPCVGTGATRTGGTGTELGLPGSSGTTTGGCGGAGVGPLSATSLSSTCGQDLWATGTGTGTACAVAVPGRNATSTATCDPLAQTAGEGTPAPAPEMPQAPAGLVAEATEPLLRQRPEIDPDPRDPEPDHDHDELPQVLVTDQPAVTEQPQRPGAQVDPRYALGYTDSDIYREDHPDEFPPQAQPVPAPQPQPEPDRPNPIKEFGDSPLIKDLTRQPGSDDKSTFNLGPGQGLGTFGK